MDDRFDSVDVLVIGSGPIGATFARSMRQQLPEARILMVEAGPALGPRPGDNLRNLGSAERAEAERQAQGPDQTIYAAAVADRFRSLSNPAPEGAARPGTFLASRGGARVEGIPAAAMSSNVGGMGAHWTCACPTPAASEWPDCVPVPAREALLTRAADLLHLTRQAFLPLAFEARLLEALAACYPAAANDRRPQHMPMAVRTAEAPPQLVGASTIFPPIAAGGDSLFQLSPDTLCFRLEREGDRVTGAWLRDRKGARADRFVRAAVVMVAADALRTPQLLWASGIRPRALGRYLNEHARVVGMVPVAGALSGDATSARTWPEDPTMGTYWAPFDDERHPYQVQITLLEAAATAWRGQADSYVAGLSSLVPTDVSADNSVSFSDDSQDYFGLPQMHLRFSLTADDRRRIDGARQDQQRVALALNPAATGFSATVSETGSSLHYTGTVRMGTDPNISVCDDASRVWGCSNLFVGGNGVIPTAIASNSTLLSVMLACRAGDAAVASLRAAA